MKTNIHNIAVARRALQEARKRMSDRQEEPDAYQMVSTARGEYAAAHYIAEHPAGMGWGEVSDINIWATLVTDALGSAETYGFSPAEVLALVTQWKDNPPEDDTEATR